MAMEMDFQYIIMVLTVVLAGAATMISIALALFFARSNQRIGRAMTLMFLAEALCNAIFATFASLEVWGDLPEINPMISTALRWVAMTCAILSSLHLSYCISSINSD